MINLFRKILAALRNKPTPYVRPPRPSISKKYEEMNDLERAREAARLDDFTSYLRHTHPEKLNDHCFRGMIATAFFGAWEAGFLDGYCGGATPNQDAVEKALAAGMRAGLVRADLWPRVED